MGGVRLRGGALGWWGFGFVVGGVILATAPARAADGEQKNTVRPEVGRPLQAAQKLVADKKFNEALAKIHDAENATNK